ncbi:FxLYD domain-containing protein [Chloroflexota bacterium]
MKHSKLLIVAITFSLLSVMFIGCTPTPAPVPAPAPTLETAGKISIISHEMIREASIPKVQVKIKNVGSGKIGLVEATVDFFDGNGNLIDSTIATMTDLEANQTWDCVFTCSGEGCKRVIKYEIQAQATTIEQRRIDMGWK